MDFNIDQSIVVAIDGYSSCGKSTFARRIATEMGYVFIDTGAMYRAVTLFAIDNRVELEQIASRLNEIDIEFRFNSERGASDVYLNGRCVEDQIRTIQVSNMVSRVSSIEQVREKLVALQQKMGQRRGIVMDGRDIGTVVFPDAELKIFMCADSMVRAERRYEELKAKGQDVSMEEIEKNVRERDYLDENRDISPLRRAEDAVVLDNSSMSVEQQMKWFEEQLSRLKL